MVLYEHFFDAIDQAVEKGTLTEPFNPKDVQKACPGFAPYIYGSFLSKFSQGNAARNIELFQRMSRGSYRRLPFYVKRNEYIDLLRPLFLPDGPAGNDIINYFSSLLRVLGMEDKGWDPYVESRATVYDLNGFFKVNLPKKLFSKPQDTQWRLGLLMYTHIVEMDAPYEVILNLLRFRLGHGYSPNPYFMFLKPGEQKSFRKRGISTIRKIELIRELSINAGLELGAIFDDFYNNKLRNAISHSDYILTNDGFRCRGGISGNKGFQMSYDKLDQTILSVKAFIAAFFYLEHAARSYWGGYAEKAFPYDPVYKGLLEVLTDKQDLMCGFKVHWPNNSESYYRRTEDRVEMVNCMLSPKHSTIQHNVGLYARNPGQFSPLVEFDGIPVYTKRQGNQDILNWPGDESI